MKKNNKKIILAISIIIATIAIVAGIMTIGNKKKSTEISKEKTEDYSIKITNKSAESEKIKISIENVAYADKYLILDYNVIAENTEEPFFLENYAKKNEFGLYIDRTIKIDGEPQQTKKDYSDQISYKISDTEAKVYDFIEIEDLPDKFDLEVIFFENDFTITPDMSIENDEELDQEIDDDDVQDDEADEELVKEIDPDEYENNSEERESVLTDEEYEEIKDEYTEEWEDEETEDEEEIYEEVEGYYDGKEELDEDEIILSNSELGRITTKANKEELIKYVSVIENDENYKENNIEITNEKIIKTPFKTFVIAETTIRQVNYEDVQSDLLGDPYLYKIDIEDADGNSLNVNQIQQIKITDEEETELNDLEISEDNIPNNLTATIKTIIILGDDAKEEIKLQPYYYSYDFANDDMETVMQNKEWFKIEDGEYKETNSNNGEITVTKIEEKDNQILFYYTKKGFVPNAESIILLRNATKEFNVFYPDIIKLSGINSDEDIVGYNIENNMSYSYTEDFDDNSLGKIEDLEFTLLEGLEIQRIGEGFILDI